MLKEYLEKFDKSLEEPKKESSKSQLKEYIEKFDESLGEPIEESTQLYSHTPINEKLSTFSPVEELQSEIQDRDTIIENLKKESIELKKQVSIAEKDKSEIAEELRKTKWLENKVTLATKQVYEDKIQSVINENVDSKIIPVLTNVARRKQGNQQLNWGNWLKIPENEYLFQVNKDIARGIFEDTNALIGRKIEEVRGGDVIEAVDKNYVLTFAGDRSGATDSHATTTFNPDTYSLWNGFTVSFWVRPDEEMNQKSVILGTRATDPVARFHFGLSGTGANNIGIGIGGNDVTGINNPMEIGKWYNWVVSYTGTQGANGERKLRLWINTDARMTSNNSTSWNNQDEATDSYTHGIYFGGRNTQGSGYTSGFACALDEVAIYNKCIDSVGTFASEVYNGGTSYNHLTNAHASNLVGYWKFNEGNGNSITDHSGNGNHGTFAPISGQTTAFPIWEEIENYL